MQHKSKRTSTRRMVSSSVNYPVLFAVLIVLGFGAFGVFWVGKKLFLDKKQPQNQLTIISPTPKQPLSSPTPTIEEATPTPTPTPTPSVKLDTYTVQVLNGNGKSGAGEEARTILAEKGFKVSNVGNAVRWDYQKTEIRAKESVPQTVLDTIKNELSKLYATEIIVDSTKTGDFDIRIVLGRETP